MQFYRHSGAVPIGGLFLMLLTGTAAAFIGGLIYTVAVTWIPFVYINFLLTVIYGGLLGSAVGWSARTGCIRNNAVVTLGTLAFAALGLYTAWAFLPLAMIGTDAALLGFHPIVLLEFVKLLYTEGSWGIMGDTPVTGLFLAMFWLIEAGLLVMMAFGGAMNFETSRPFCERCRRWTESDTGVLHFQTTSDNPTWSRMQMGDLAALDQLPVGLSQTGRGVRLDLSHCRHCDDCNFVTASSVNYSVDDEGNVKDDATVIFKHLGLDTHSVSRIREKAKEAERKDLANQAAEGKIEGLNL